jgi:hypothetical protein
MIMSRDQNAGRSYSTKIDNSSIERVEEFKYLGTTLTNKNYIQEKIKSRLKLGNACYYSVQNLLSSSLLSKKLKIKIYRTIILPVVLYGCETWSMTLRDERRLRVFENRVLRRVFGRKRDEVTGELRKLHNEELSDLYSLPDILRVVKSRRMRWTCMWRVWGGGVCKGFWWGNRRVRDHWGDPDLDGRIILLLFRNWEGVVGIGWSWLRIRRGGGHL